MQVIGRKVYMNWGKHVVAVEILAESSEDFFERTGILLENDKSVVCEVVDMLGQRVERKVGNILREPNYTDTKNLQSFMDSVKTITNEDIESLTKNSGIPLELCNNDVADLKDWGSDFSSYFDGSFVGYIEVPNSYNHQILSNYCQLSYMSFVNDNKKAYVPVFIMERKGHFFDTDTDENIKGLDWVVLFLGTDNLSYGQRFINKIDAKDFVKKGFKAGFEQLRGYNS
jgi:hypothetical protein